MTETGCHRRVIRLSRFKVALHKKVALTQVLKRVCGIRQHTFPANQLIFFGQKPLRREACPFLELSHANQASRCAKKEYKHYMDANVWTKEEAAG